MCITPDLCLPERKRDREGESQSLKGGEQARVSTSGLTIPPSMQEEDAFAC